MEIGCGNGRLLYLAQQAGFEVCGLELSSFLAESVRQRLSIAVEALDFFAFQAPPGVWYDVVILQHVLEHLAQPVEAMNRIRQLLRPGGLALLEFPNTDGLDLRFKRALERVGLRRKNYPSDYKPGHANEFCRRSFALLARKSGFRVESWRTYSWKPLTDLFYGFLAIGNKARVVVRRIG